MAHNLYDPRNLPFLELRRQCFPVAADCFFFAPAPDILGEYDLFECLGRLVLDMPLGFGLVHAPSSLRKEIEALGWRYVPILGSMDR